MKKKWTPLCTAQPQRNRSPLQRGVNVSAIERIDKLLDTPMKHLKLSAESVTLQIRAVPLRDLSKNILEVSLWINYSTISPQNMLRIHSSLIKSKTATRLIYSSC